MMITAMIMMHDDRMLIAVLNENGDYNCKNDEDGSADDANS